VVKPAEFKPAMMRENWLLLLAGDCMPEAPVWPTAGSPFATNLSFCPGGTTGAPG